jgi:ubiquinone/menaquinone biosynthesis C-methylase UbiE
MMSADEKQNRAAIEDRFTATAKVFGDYAVVERKRLAETLAQMVGTAKTQKAADLATGPGTLALRFAAHVKSVAAIDLTPAMLERARKTARSEQITNVTFVRADAQDLPIATGALDLVVTSYSLHHVPDQARMLREMARALKPGGRVGIIDILVPDADGASQQANAIEIARDRSHTKSLRREEFAALLEQAGLKTLDTKFEDYARSFDHWLHVAGWHRGDAQYEEARWLMEAQIGHDTAGFHPKFAVAVSTSPGSIHPTDARPDIEMRNNAFFIAAEKC